MKKHKLINSLIKESENNNLDVENSLLHTVIHKLSKDVNPSEVILWLLSVIGKQQTSLSKCIFECKCRIDLKTEE